MRLFKDFLAFSVLLLSFSSIAQDETTTNAYISDDLFIYMLAGAGKNYRILGTIQAGSEIQITGEEANGYSQIIAPNGKTTWIESQYISQNPSLRNVIAELNTKLAQYSESELSNQTTIANANDTIALLTSKNEELTKEIANLNNELTNVKSKLKHQDQEILTQWFFNGAIVLGIGLLLGGLLPRLIGRKRKPASWT